MTKAFWDSEREVENVQKSGTKSSFYKIKVTAKGKQNYVDVREFYTAADGSERTNFKGTSIPVSDVPAMIEALQKAIQ